MSSPKKHYLIDSSSKGSPQHIVLDNDEAIFFVHSLVGEDIYKGSIADRNILPRLVEIGLVEKTNPFYVGKEREKYFGISATKKGREIITNTIGVGEPRSIGWLLETSFPEDEVMKRLKRTKHDTTKRKHRYFAEQLADPNFISVLRGIYGKDELLGGFEQLWKNLPVKNSE